MAIEKATQRIILPEGNIKFISSYGDTDISNAVGLLEFIMGFSVGTPLENVEVSVRQPFTIAPYSDSLPYAKAVFIHKRMAGSTAIYVAKEYPSVSLVLKKPGETKEIDLNHSLLNDYAYMDSNGQFYTLERAYFK